MHANAWLLTSKIRISWLSIAKVEIHILLVNNGASWQKRHIATMFVNESKQKRGDLAYLITCNKLFFASTVMFLTKQVSADLTVSCLIISTKIQLRA